MCLTLPYWRDVLGGLRWPPCWCGGHPSPWPAPCDVGTAYPFRMVVALWERYNRSAIANLVQTPTFVLDYDVLLEDPQASLSGLTSWLASIEEFGGMPPWDDERAHSFVDATLRHESVQPSDGDDRIVLDQQRQLVEHLTEVSGGHRALPQPRTGRVSLDDRHSGSPRCLEPPRAADSAATVGAHQRRTRLVRRRAGGVTRPPRQPESDRQLADHGTAAVGDRMVGERPRPTPRGVGDVSRSLTGTGPGTVRTSIRGGGRPAQLFVVPALEVGERDAPRM